MAEKFQACAAMNLPVAAKLDRTRGNVMPEPENASSEGPKLV